MKRSLIDLKGRDPKEFNRALHFVGDFEFAAADLAKLDISKCLPLLDGEEQARVQSAVEAIRTVTAEIRRAA